MKKILGQKIRSKKNVSPSITCGQKIVVIIGENLWEVKIFWAQNILESL